MSACILDKNASGISMMASQGQVSVKVLKFIDSKKALVSSVCHTFSSYVTLSNSNYNVWICWVNRVVNLILLYIGIQWTYLNGYWVLVECKIGNRATGRQLKFHPQAHFCLTFLFLIGRRLWRGHFRNHTNSGWSRGLRSKFYISRKKEKSISGKPIIFEDSFLNLKPTSGSCYSPQLEIQRLQLGLLEWLMLKLPSQRNYFPWSPVLPETFGCLLAFIYLFYHGKLYKV